MKKIFFTFIICSFFFLTGCNITDTDKTSTTNLTESGETYLIKSNSMNPAIMNGALVKVDTDISINEYEVGDYIMVNVTVGTSTTVQTAMIIVSIDIVSNEGNDSYTFTVGSLQTEVTSTVSSQDIIGLIIEINNP